MPSSHIELRRKGRNFMVPDKQMGDLIRNARIAAGFDQVQASEAAGVSQPYWSRLETGEREPSLSTLRAIANALGVQLQDLLPDE